MRLSRDPRRCLSRWKPCSLETLKEHRLLRTGLWAYIRSTSFPVILPVPLIYACVIPFALLDLSVTIYQSVCFPIDRIPKIRRRDYLIFDRLAYLNAIEESRLHRLFLCERPDRVHRRNRGPNRTALLSDQTRASPGATTLALWPFSAIRRRESLQSAIRSCIRAYGDLKPRTQVDRRSKKTQPYREIVANADDIATQLT